ncbi:MAG: Gar/GrdA family gentamicin resistance ATP-binding protein [Sphingopyxis sp.]|uniref:Gar/GrdA family gentamicin resistance ATP-binding protein n=1 Tax=Sphingopyxis sp. TaxID=1908224 RepID=UPI002AB859B3|nr:Gar/GrdA family gentamicin resistance ATP-binding protein [Sphingopyxis sp.]MDZ3831258.1 Gar/GrdA family gentamicin resistance ATP-binding protein [Sphingopyxis sp.]
MEKDRPFILLLNGPLGCGKSTLGEALVESLDQAVFLDGDALCALNPPPSDERAVLNQSIALLVSQHLANGYRTFVISHAWEMPGQLEDLQDVLDQLAAPTVKVLLLTLPRDANLQRIDIRRRSRAIDEADFEDAQFQMEHELFSNSPPNHLGIPFDATESVDVLVRNVKEMLGLDSI